MIEFIKQWFKARLREREKEELVGQLMKLSDKNLYELMKKYKVDIGPGWDPPYVWEEKLNLAGVLVDKIVPEKLSEEIEEVENSTEKLKQKLIEIRKKIEASDAGETPQDELELDIYADLDQLSGGAIGDIVSLEKKKISKFDLDNIHRFLDYFNGLIEKLGEKKFRKNLKMSSQYDLCVKAIRLMEEYNKLCEE